MILFVVFNKIYRYHTIDNDLGKKVTKGAIILDVRTDSEYSKGHIEGSVNIPLGTIRESYSELDSTKTYITYCSHGLRSAKVKNILKEKGFKEVYNGGVMTDLEAIIEKYTLKE
ncbi:rhodanese-like domain-containing protein [Maribacter sp. Asnod1-A12]|uniref:rhodanese-like domain-containing protein n=1 Tax=Maribacter sp. Asnod1-A12 TaxID=3160576 RepID=UPI00386447CB